MPKKPKTPTDDQYAEAWREFESGKVKIGLWAKLYVDNEGDDKKTKAAYIKQRALSARNNRFYATAWKEVGSGEKDEGLWARLYAENEGDEKKTKVGYLTERVQQMKLPLKEEKKKLALKEEKLALKEEKKRKERQRLLDAILAERNQDPNPRSVKTYTREEIQRLQKDLKQK